MEDTQIRITGASANVLLAGRGSTALRSRKVFKVTVFFSLLQFILKPEIRSTDDIISLSTSLSYFIVLFHDMWLRVFRYSVYLIWLRF